MIKIESLKYGTLSFVFNVIYAKNVPYDFSAISYMSVMTE